MRRLIIFVLLLPFIGGCCACRKGSPVIGNLENTVWILKEMSGQSVSSKVSVSFDPNSKVMSGKSASGEIFSGYHLYAKEAGNIEFLQPGCKGNDPDFNTLSGILTKVSTVKIDGGHLLLVDSSSEIVAVFAQ